MASWQVIQNKDRIEFILKEDDMVVAELLDLLPTDALLLARQLNIAVDRVILWKINNKE